MQPPPTPAKRTPRHWLRGEMLQIAAMVLLLMAARNTLANHYHVPTGSMKHTLQVGDRVAVDMRAYGLRLPFTAVELLHTGTPQRGDVAVFDSPRDGTRLIKRVVAVAGDAVELVDGRLAINGVPMATLEDRNTEVFRQHRAYLNLQHGGGPDVHGLVIAAGQVLMLGDARGNSLDGRYFGLVRAGDVYARAVAIYYRRGQGLGWSRL